MIIGVAEGAVVQSDPGKFTVHRIEKGHQPGHNQTGCIKALVKHKHSQSRQDKAQGCYLVGRDAMSCAYSRCPACRCRPEPFGHQVSHTFIGTIEESFFQAPAILCGDRQEIRHIELAQVFLVSVDQCFRRLAAQPVRIVTLSTLSENQPPC